MANFLSSHFISSDVALLFLRLTSGSMMLFGHGVAKLERFNDEPIRFGDPIGIGTLPSLILATLAEVVCAGLIMAGYKTRYALIPLIITMLVAGLITHLDDPWGKKELAVLYFTVFLTLFLTGPGRYSVDYKQQPSPSEPGEETVR
jgi:putative oxidoreductase